MLRLLPRVWGMQVARFGPPRVLGQRHRWRAGPLVYDASQQFPRRSAWKLVKGREDYEKQQQLAKRVLKLRETTTPATPADPLQQQAMRAAHAFDGATDVANEVPSGEDARDFVRKLGPCGEKQATQLMSRLLALSREQYDSVCDSIEYLVEELGVQRGNGQLGVHRLLWRLPNLYGAMMRGRTAIEDKVKYFEEELGVGIKAIRQSFVRSPSIINFSLENLQAKVRVLQEAGLRSMDLTALFRTRLHTFTFSNEHNLQPKIRWLEEHGFTEEQRRRIISRSGFLAIKMERLGTMFHFLLEQGLSEEQCRIILARHPTVFDSSIENNVRPKLQWLRSIGVTEEELPIVLVGCSPLFTLSLDDNLKPKYDAIVEELNPPRIGIGNWFVLHNHVLTCSLYGRLLPRLKFIERRKQRKWTQKERWQICKHTDSKFVTLAKCTLEEYMEFRERFMTENGFSTGEYKGRTT